MESIRSMCRDRRLALRREGLPGLCHGQQLQALAFVPRLMGKGVTLTGMPPIRGRLVKGAISVAQLHVFGEIAGDKNAHGKLQIIGHAAPLTYSPE